MLRKRRQVPLWIRFLLLAVLNLAILGTVFVVFLRMQLQPELESFLMARAREKINTVTTLITSDLSSTDPSQWDNVLSRYSKEYGITFILYRNTGEQLAGPPTPLPSQVDVRMPRGGPPPPRGGGPPPPRGDGPPRPRDGGPPPPRNASPQSQPGPPFLAVTDSDATYWVGVRMPIIEVPQQEPLRSVLMFVSPTFFTNPFFFEIKPWLGIAAAAVFISALCWLPLVRNLTRSIAEMMRATARITEGRFDVAVKTKRNDELGLLGASINQMAGRLETLTEGRKRFLGAAAHELRSPIARMQLAAEILGRNTNAPGQKYIDDLKDDIAMMSRLTDELLQFAKAEGTPDPVQLVRTNVAEAVWTAARQEGSEGTNIRINVDPSLHVRANMEYLVRALANTFRNAIRYAGDRGPIDVSAHQENQNVQISVADSGPGVPNDALDKIFTPFYRLDDDRDRRTGGTGLGLAIVRTCIEASGGTVECRNRQSGGLEVLINLRTA